MMRRCGRANQDLRLVDAISMITAFRSTDTRVDMMRALAAHVFEEIR